MDFQDLVEINDTDPSRLIITIIDGIFVDDVSESDLVLNTLIVLV